LAVSLRNPSAPGYGEDTYGKTDTRAMSVATALFFMVGFLTCLNDVIIPHLKSIFELNYAEALSVQLAFFTAYFVFSYPGGKLVDKFGYKKTMVAGLLVMAAGAFGFLPAAKMALFPVFLIALVVLAAGMTIVQVAVNPYVTVIGPAATASSRLNLAQAFNSVGTFIAPFFGSVLILGTAPAPATPEKLHTMTDIARQVYRATQAHTVQLPYIGIGLTLVLLATALATIKLKTTTGVSQHTQDFRPGAFAEALSRPDSIWRHPWLLFGAVGIFVYVGAEVAIGSLLVNYMGLPEIAGYKEAYAARFLMFYWGGAMIGRFIGSALLRVLNPGKVLASVAVGAMLLILVTTHTTGNVSGYALLAIGLMNSIMFPTIFSLACEKLGARAADGSGIINVAIVGGALVPVATGALADATGGNLALALALPALCYAIICAFGLFARKPAPDYADA